MQRHLERLGWVGSYETVKLPVRPLRTPASVAALKHRRFEIAPREQAQVDRGSACAVRQGEYHSITSASPLNLTSIRSISN